jgi:hypothetical protein
MKRVIRGRHRSVVSAPWKFKALMNAYCTAAFMGALAVSLTRSTASEISSPPDQAKAKSTIAWPAETVTSRPWTRWWWHGSAVDKQNLTRCLESYRAAGLGGVEITCIYGVKGEESRSLPYLSDPWLDVVHHTLEEAKRLGMGVDLPTGSGWRIGGPSVAAEDGNAELTLRRETLQPGASYRTTFSQPLPQAIVAFNAGGEFVELTNRMDATGGLTWDAPAGTEPWTVYVAGMRLTGELVERPAPGGEGFDVNPFSRRSLESYLKVFEDRTNKLPRDGVRAAFHDSFEYEGNWCDDFLDEFRQRRGYSLEHQFPALSGEGDADHIARVKSDYRRTMADLVLYDFIQPWADWSHDRGHLVRLQAHGTPGNWLDLYGASDIPETESFGRLEGGDGHPLLFRFASSAAHVAGRQLVSSETATWLDEHFTVTLAQMKKIIDRQFLAGVNHTMYHGTAYSPADAAWPGWLFYASTEVNPQNSIWRDLPALNQYVTRCQSMLQYEAPDNDILLYWPFHDVIHHTEGLRQKLSVHNAATWLRATPFGQAAQWLDAEGYAFDYISDQQLSACRVDGDRIKTPGSIYRAVVVPPTRHMPGSTLAALRKLAEDGAMVVFLRELPLGPPGLAQIDEQQSFEKNLAALEAALNGNASKFVRSVNFGRGRVILGSDLRKIFQAQSMPCESSIRREGLQFIRRKCDGGRCYFVNNERDEPFDGWVNLSHSFTAAVLMDPLSARVGQAKISDGKEIRLQLDPGQSIFVRTLNDAASVAPWQYDRVRSDAISLKGTWTVEFVEGGPELPPSAATKELPSWTKLSEPAERFAGTATYTLSFDAPMADEQAYLLSLGEVQNSARVSLNGQLVATLFAPPFQTRIDGLHPGKNELRVEVTNVPANRIRDLDRRGADWRRFHDINFVNIDYRPFDASDWPVRDAGLLGPVTLQPIASD